MLIKDINHFKEICKETKELLGNQLDCFISNGMFRSSKTLIFQEDGGIVIVNEIDSSSFYLTSIDKVMTSKKTNIGKSIENGTFFVYDYEIEKLDRIKIHKII